MLKGPLGLIFQSSTVIVKPKYRTCELLEPGLAQHYSYVTGICRCVLLKFQVDALLIAAREKTAPKQGIQHVCKVWKWHTVFS